MPTMRFLPLIVLLFAAIPLHAAEHLVADGVALRKLEKVAKPGDVIILQDGTWKDQKMEVEFTGTAEAPIVIKAKSYGSVILSGASSLDLTGEHVTLENLIFADGSPDDDNVIRIGGSHCRVTNCGIFYFNPADAAKRYFWVSLYGHHHRVDHCAFAGQNHSGVTVVAWLKVKEGEEVGSHQIDHNYFGFRPKGAGNGFETMRIGDSSTSMTNAKCVVEYNLFEEVDGEIEMISNKSCENIYRHNTFLRSAGCLTLRHGNRCVVENNVIRAERKKGSGGIRVIGEDHVVRNNVIEGTEARADAAISLSAGNKNAKLHQHAQVKNAVIEGNWVSDNKGAAICFNHGLGDEGMTLFPENVTLTGNRFIARGEDAVVEKEGAEGAVWKADNLAQGAKLGVPETAGLKLVADIPAPTKPMEALTRAQVGPEGVDWTERLKTK